jgi:hypothetical protein
MTRLRFFALVALLAALVVPAATASAASVFTVRPGGDIQTALDRAPAGGTVVVERGTYSGNLLIERSVHLVGHGAVIVPDTALPPTPNSCPPVSGICVLGSVTPQGQVTSMITNVSISGFTVRGFSGMGVMVIGVNFFTASNNTFANNGDYGIFANQSSHVSYLYNVSRNNNAPGLYIGDSPNATVTVVGNQSYNNNGEGILFRDSLGGRITNNVVRGNCAGIFVLDTGAPGAAGNVSVALNDVWNNNRLCPGEEGEAPPLGGIGIALIGAQNTTVAVNLVRNNVGQQGSGIPGGGILVVSGALAGGPDPKGNNVHHNLLTGNAPSDILTDGMGSGNTIKNNSCTTSLPPGNC